MTLSSGLVIRVLAGIALIVWAAVQYATSGGWSPALPAVVGLFFIVRGLAAGGGEARR